jgi:radical SAM superfamily enzyme YgiQ (UPF0313 family)
VDEPFFDGLCDVLFSGEADETWPEFVECFATGKKYKQFYKQKNPTDMSRVPKARVDLLKVDRYASGSLQFSRGCPFQCEFCDIIVTFGTARHAKRPERFWRNSMKCAKPASFLLYCHDIHRQQVG